MPTQPGTDSSGGCGAEQACKGYGLSATLLSVRASGRVEGIEPLPGHTAYSSQLLIQSIAIAMSAALKEKLTMLCTRTRRRMERVVTVTSDTANEVPIVVAK